jgi:hypothetical protein
MDNLARLILEQGDIPRARQMLEQVLETRRHTLGPRHTDVTQSEFILLVLNEKLEDDVKATADLVIHLQWLLYADEGKLSSPQREARDHLKANYFPDSPRQPK